MMIRTLLEGAIVATLGLLLVLSPGCGESVGEEKAPPQWGVANLFDAKHLDLGEVGNGTVVGAFEFVNASEHDVRIASVLASCNCSEVVLEVNGLEYQVDQYAASEGSFTKGSQRWREILIGPGYGGVVRIRVNEWGYGAKSAFVDVVGSVGDVVRLSWRGQRTRPVVAVPSVIHIGSVRFDSENDFAIKVNGVGDDVKNIVVSSVPDWITCRVRKEDVRSGYRIEGRAGPFSATGMLTGAIEVDVTGESGIHKVRVPVTSIVEDPIESSISGGPSARVQEVRVKVADGYAHRLPPSIEWSWEDLNVDSALVSVTPEIVQDEWQIQVEIKEGDWLVRGTVVAGNLVLVCGHPAQRVSRIPFRYSRR